MALQDLIDAASPGSTVFVPAGVYNEQITIDKPLTLRPEQGANVTIDGTGLAQGVPVISILSSNVTIRDLIIQNGPFHGIQVGNASATNLSDILIIDNQITGHANAGIITSHAASMTISNNTIENNGSGTGFNRAGIVLYPHGQTSILNNIIIDNNIDGIFARGSDSGLSIVSNIIENHSNSGITLAWDQKNTTVSFNYITNCGTGNYDEQGGIVIVQSMAETIQNNIIHNCKPYGIFWGWVPATGVPPSQILISSNQITNSLLDAIYLFSQGPGGFIPPDPFPLEPLIQNNSLLNNGRSGVYISNFYYYGPGNANPTINYNNLAGNEWGVFNATILIVNAINNWWGTNKGPYNPTLNPSGTGDPVSNNVDFIPWLTQIQGIEIAYCLIENVSLEHYNISPLTNGYSKVKMIIKVTGYVGITVNDMVTIPLDFEEWFVEKIIMQIPELNNIQPEISTTSACNAKLLDDTIQIEIKLCVDVDIEGKRTILISATEFCSPWKNLINSKNLVECDVQRKKPKKEKDKNDPINLNQRINAQIIFATCQFEKFLIKNIDISDLL
ncbi:MAG: hypothetical protein GX054_08495 [Clostridiales bacterium]|nr:hypothetical protein [Clostridiales bacterium]